MSTDNKKYRFRIDRYPDLTPHEDTTQKEETRLFGEGITYVFGQSPAIDFHLEDGHRHGSEYAYLIYHAFETTEDGQTIKLFFTTHMVVIKGLRLEKIYDEILKHKLTMLKASGDRYLAQAEDGEVYITQIDIDWHSKKSEGS